MTTLHTSRTKARNFTKGTGAKVVNLQPTRKILGLNGEGKKAPLKDTPRWAAVEASNPLCQLADFKKLPR